MNVIQRRGSAALCRNQEATVDVQDTRAPSVEQWEYFTTVDFAVVLPLH